MELDDEYELPFDCLESAEREYNELRDRGQDDEQVTFNYAWMLLKSGRRDPINLIRGADLLHELSKTTESEEKRVLYGYYLAVARYRQGQKKEALEQVQKILQLRPTHSKALALRGRIRSEYGVEAAMVGAGIGVVLGGILAMFRR